MIDNPFRSIPIREYRMNDENMHLMNIGLNVRAAKSIESFILTSLEIAPFSIWDVEDGNIAWLLNERRIVKEAWVRSIVSFLEWIK